MKNPFVYFNYLKSKHFGDIPLPVERPEPITYCCHRLMNQASTHKWKCRVCGKVKKI